MQRLHAFSGALSETTTFSTICGSKPHADVSIVYVPVPSILGWGLLLFSGSFKCHFEYLLYPTAEALRPSP
jgi:hypothetical protein